MNWILELALYALLLVTAVVSLQVKGLLAAAVASAAYSLTAALIFLSMGAVDVGFTEAVVGAGVVGVFFIAAVHKTTRRSID